MKMEEGKKVFKCRLCLDAFTPRKLGSSISLCDKCRPSLQNHVATQEEIYSETCPICGYRKAKHHHYCRACRTERNILKSVHSHKEAKKNAETKKIVPHKPKIMRCPQCGYHTKITSDFFICATCFFACEKDKALSVDQFSLKNNKSYQLEAL